MKRNKMNSVDILKSRVEELGIKAEYTEHEPIVSIEAYRDIMGLSYEDGISTMIFKTEKGYFGVYRRDDRKINSGKLKKALGVKSLSLATPDEVKSQFSFIVGSVGVYHPKLTYFMDSVILEKAKVVGGAGISTLDIVIAPKDLQKLSNAMVVEISDESAIRNGDGKKRILTGDRPTGQLHIGHFVGSLKNRVKLQDEYDQYVLIADVQALTDNFDQSEMVSKNVRQLALDYLSVGIDPEKSTFVIQSLIPEIAELTVFYLNLVSLNRVLRNPTVKEEIKQKGFDESVPAGFAMYPVSQAADITAFNASLVPVGEDQLPMIEQTAEIVKRFNSLYGKTLVEPKALVGDFPRLVGTDGNAKMSKSVGNCIYLADSADIVTKKVMSMYTDPNRIRATDPGKVDGNPVFIYHDAFNPNVEEVADLKERYLVGKVGDVEVKQKLAVAMNNMLEPMREKRAYYEANMDKVDEILSDGVKKSRIVSKGVMEKVREAMKIDYPYVIR